MPELPEVETTLNGIAPLIENSTVTSVKVENYNLRYGINPNINKILRKKKLIHIKRRAKYLIFHFENGYLIIHLGMSGSLNVSKTRRKLKKHEHIEINFSTGVLRLHDPRRFGCCVWTKTIDDHPLIINLGIEPLTEDFNGEFLYTEFQKTALTAKAALMNNKIVVGVGNIYANESLHMAKINPKIKARRIGKKRCQTVAETTKKVLSDAIQLGGTTLRDFTKEDGNPGYFKNNLLVYDREGKKCKECQTAIKRILQNQRSTFYCPLCQKF